MNNAMINQAHTYTDFSGLNALKAQAGRDESQALKEVAKQFESMFVSMMLKSMRDANKPFEEGNFLKSNQTDFYRDMFDSQLALSMTKGKGIGLADSLYRQLSKQTGIDADFGTHGSAMDISDYKRDIAPIVQKIVETVDQVDKLVDESESIERSEESEDRSATTVFAVNLNEGTEIDSENLKDTVSESVVASNNYIQNATQSYEEEPEQFNSAKEFVDYLYPVAKKVEQETGIDARFLLAQSALETGWGKHMIKKDSDGPSFNLFGIKADHRWSGDKVDITTSEYREGIKMKEVASFRSYGSYEESFRDYVDFIKSNDRYSEAVNVMDDPEKFAEELHKAGYATDPNYSNKVQRIFNSDLLRSALSSSTGQG